MSTLERSRDRHEAVRVHLSRAHPRRRSRHRLRTGAVSKKEAHATLQRYIRIDTCNPPGDVRKAADLIEAILKGENIPSTRYESAEGRSIVLARLKGSGAAVPILLMHHMDVVPADAARWKRGPFGAEVAEGAIWGPALKKRYPDAIVTPMLVPYGSR